jgi:hypothetical protein
LLGGTRAKLNKEIILDKIEFSYQSEQTRIATIF